MECDKCGIQEPLTVSGVIGALKGFKTFTFDGLYYYFHGPMEQNKTGLTIEEAVKYFETDTSVVVVDLASSSMYRGGKLYIDDKHNKTTAESAIANFRAAAEKICNTGLSGDDVYALQMCSTQNF